MSAHKIRASRFFTPEYILVFFVLYSFVGLNPFSIGLDEFNYVESDSGFIRRVIYLGFLGISFLFFLKLKRQEKNVLESYWQYFIFAAFLLLSTIWSVEPGFTFVRAILYLISLFTLVFFVCSLDIDFFLNKLTDLFALLLVLSFGSILILPSAVHAIPELAGNWRGIFLHKNDAGLAMVFSIILFLRAYKLRENNIWLVFSCSAFVFLYFTASKTSMGFLAVGLVVGLMYATFSYSVNFMRNYYSILLVIVSLLSVLYFMSSFEILAFIDDVLYDPTSFTGRAMIWDYLLNLVLDKPLFGHGYNAIWGVGDASRLYDFTSVYDIWIYQITQGHNSYLDVVLSVGLVGLLFFCSIYVFNHVFFINSNARIDRAFLFVFYGFCSFFLLHGLMESNFLLVDKGRWTLFHILVLIKVRLAYESRRRWRITK